MIAYTVTKRVGDVETAVRVEVDESMTRHDRAEEIAMALDEAGIGEASEPAPSVEPMALGDVPVDRHARLRATLERFGLTPDVVDELAGPQRYVPVTEAIDLAVCGVIGVEWCYVDDDVSEGDPIVVWVRTDPGVAVAVRDIGAAIRSVGAGRDWVVRRVVDTIERDVAIEAARLDERIKIPAYDTKPFRDRIREDRERFVGIADLTKGVVGNTQIAHQIATRAAAEVMP